MLLLLLKCRTLRGVCLILLVLPYSLRSRYLARNPLMCDCELYGAYNVSRFIPTFSGTCISTDDKSHAIRDLELWDFCREYFTPVGLS